jgi:hypothetical protein
MISERESQTFFFEGSPVGYFSAESFPIAPGRYPYMPYRSAAHYRLVAALKSVGPQQCHHIVGDEKRQFTVSAWISYGVLELTDFES